MGRGAVLPNEATDTAWLSGYRVAAMKGAAWVVTGAAVTHAAIPPASPVKAKLLPVDDGADHTDTDRPWLGTLVKTTTGVPPFLVTDMTPATTETPITSPVSNDSSAALRPVLGSILMPVFS